jgi:O-acetylserine/cysteine efflux transporter
MVHWMAGRIGLAPKDFALAVFIMLIWGMNYTIGKLAIVELPPFLLMTLRFALVSLLLIPFCRWPKEGGRQLVLIAIMMGWLHFPLIYVGLRGVESGVASLLMQLQLPFTLILSWLVFGDKVRRLQILGIVIAFAGLILLLAEPELGRGTHTMAEYGWGIAATILSALALAVNLVLQKRTNPLTLSPLTLTAWISFLSVPVMLVCSLLFEGDLIQRITQARWAGWGGLLFMTFAASMFGLTYWNKMMHRYPIGLMSSFFLLIPIFAVAGGAIFLHEPTTAKTLAATMLVLVGMGCMMYRPKH